MIALLVGKKTYILSALAAVVTGAYCLNYLTSEQWAVLMGLLGFGTQVTQRAAMK